MTEFADCSRKQTTLRCVMEIDVELVREHEFHPAERIPWSGLLPQAVREPFRRELGPIHRLGRNFLSVGIPALEDLEMISR
jgi:hypothetical protein